MGLAAPLFMPRYVFPQVLTFLAAIILQSNAASGDLPRLVFVCLKSVRNRNAMRVRRTYRPLRRPSGRDQVRWKSCEAAHTLHRESDHAPPLPA